MPMHAPVCGVSVMSQRLKPGQPVLQTGSHVVTGAGATQPASPDVTGASGGAALSFAPPSPVPPPSLGWLASTDPEEVSGIAPTSAAGAGPPSSGSSPSSVGPPTRHAAI